MLEQTERVKYFTKYDIYGFIYLLCCFFNSSCQISYCLAQRNKTYKTAIFYDLPQYIFLYFWLKFANWHNKFTLPRHIHNYNSAQRQNILSGVVYHIAIISQTNLHIKCALY